MDPELNKYYDKLNTKAELTETREYIKTEKIKYKAQALKDCSIL